MGGICSASRGGALVINLVPIPEHLPKHSLGTNGPFAACRMTDDDFVQV